MKLIISPKDDFEKEFVYSYLPVYMYNILVGTIDIEHTDRLNKSYNFDSEKVLRYAFANLRVTEDSLHYIVSINKNLKMDNLFIDQLMNMITYGNLTTKGYPIVNKIFNMVAKYLPEIHKEWKRGR